VEEAEKGEGEEEEGAWHVAAPVDLLGDRPQRLANQLLPPLLPRTLPAKVPLEILGIVGQVSAETGAASPFIGGLSGREGLRGGIWRAGSLLASLDSSEQCPPA
jgi:hypothetical protein